MGPSEFRMQTEASVVGGVIWRRDVDVAATQQAVDLTIIDPVVCFCFFELLLPEIPDDSVLLLMDDSPAGQLGW